MATRAPRWLGLVTFLAGLAVLGFVFSLALSLFNTPPEAMLKLRSEEPLDVNLLTQQGFSFLTRVILLFVMATVGSLIANRGVKLMLQPSPASETTDRPTSRPSERSETPDPSTPRNPSE